MSPQPGGVTAHPCTICGEPYPYSSACTQTHPGLCHDCATRNLYATLGYYEHPDPEMPAPPQSLVLSPRDVAALIDYQRHVQRTVLP